ncbi:MAG: acetylornithine deacetylase [Bacteroidota bacterium]
MKNDKKTTVQILEDLIRFKVLGGESNLSIIEYIESYLSEYDVDYHLVRNEAEQKASIHCRIGPAVDGGIILSGHTDVVPVEGQEWDTDPFELTDVGDKYFARGSCDMKGFNACCLAALPEMLAADLKYPIYFAFSYDEEVGCLASEDLAEDILKTYPEKPTYCLVGEPTMMKPTIGQKGIAIFVTSLNGSAGHSSRIKQEVSAIHEGAKLILWLENKMDTLIRDGQIDDRFTPPHTSIHCGISKKSGVAPNVIADHFEFYWDVRVIPKDDEEQIKKDFDAYCEEKMNILRQRFPEFKIETKAWHPPVLPLDTSADKPIVELTKSWSGVTELDAVSYAAEAGFFSAAGFETIICGPGDIAQAHRANEFIAKDQLRKGEEMIRNIIAHFSK